jgi:DNA-binding GntR family transcriptional regulator
MAAGRSGAEHPTERLNDVAYEQIKHDIVLCTFAPGEELTESQLGLRYGLGKAPIRSALGRLRQEGLVLPLPRLGHRVAPLTIRDVQEVYQLRLLLEPAAARLAAGRVDRDLLLRMERAVEAGYEPGNAASEAAFLEANRRFHLAIAEASGNQRLARAIAQILLEVDRILHLGFVLRDRSKEYQHTHKEIIAALVAGDGERAEKLLAEGIAGSRDLVLEALLSSRSVLEVNLGRNCAAL